MLGYLVYQDCGSMKSEQKYFYKGKMILFFGHCTFKIFLGENIFKAFVLQIGGPRLNLWLAELTSKKRPATTETQERHIGWITLLQRKSGIPILATATKKKPHQFPTLRESFYLHEVLMWSDFNFLDSKTRYIFLALKF